MTHQLLAACAARLSSIPQGSATRIKGTGIDIWISESLVGSGWFQINCSTAYFQLSDFMG